MKYIISGTNRPDSRSFEVSKIIQNLYLEQGESTEIIDLKDLPIHQLDGSQYSENQPKELTDVIEKINHSEGLIIVCPEYNGSVPGILKYFIDHWSYPKSFENRPVALVGLGGGFGGLRPVEHLQQVFGYRNAFIFPIRVFITNVWDVLVDQKITDPLINDLLLQQTKGFQKFVKALNTAGLV